MQLSYMLQMFRSLFCLFPLCFLVHLCSLLGIYDNVESVTNMKMEDKKTYGHPLQAMSHRFQKIPYDSSVMDSGVHKNKARQTDNHFMYAIGLFIFHKQIQLTKRHLSLTITAFDNSRFKSSSQHFYFKLCYTKLCHTKRTMKIRRND